MVEGYFDIGVLPQFNRDDDHGPLPPAVATLRRALRSAAAVPFCTPEYLTTRAEITAVVQALVDGDLSTE